MESSIEKGIKVYTTTENDNPEISNEDYNTLFVYLCAFCDEQFHSNKFLVKHMSNEHFVEAENKELNNSIQYSEDESESYILEELKKQTSDELYSIETLSNKDFDLEHQVEADTEGFESDAWVLESENLNESTKTDENKIKKNEKDYNRSTKKKGKSKTLYECAYCEKQYQSKNSLENHRKVHEEIDKIKCRYESCSKSFTSSSGYFHHMRTHNEENQFQCEFCSKGFFQKCNLEVHIRRFHTLDKPFKCQYCEKAFASSTDRQIHQRLHTGEKPFFCDLCDKKFITSSKMSYHRKMHFKVKKFCCKKCNEKFSTRSLLYKHSLDHETGTTYDCDVCGKRCRRKQTLMSHRKLHSKV
ncbi:zinc finger protein 675-like isoform X1 [Eupeodes corollae]|uniref:zinc finger protein 675-like isoform X1 n=1 Tax=Eupeodes corollae TaxID=290404 RepID=UPI0024905859|nr:zinc finger protein 675-like isoform X1 [Eupeodes corollae]